MQSSSVITKGIAYGIVFFLQTAFAQFSFAQPTTYRFENITDEQGLADRVVNAIIQDTRGFIWIASIDGLTRYDGYNCVVYKHRSNDPYSLSDNQVNALCNDGDGFLWIGTRNGLSRYDGEYDRFENFLHDDNENSLAANEIFSLAKDGNGNLWVGTYNSGLDKLVKTSPGKGYKKSIYKFLHYRYDERNPNTISSNQVFSICFDTGGNAWVATAHGLNRIDASEKNISRFYNDPTDKNSISNNTVNRLFAANDGSVWLCGKGMLDNVTFLKNDRKQKISVKRFLPLITNSQNSSGWAINDFLIDRVGHAWVGTNDQGVFKFSPTEGNVGPSLEQFMSGPSNFDLTSLTVFSFYEDNAGIVWIGTAKGVSMYLPSKARFNELKLPANSSAARLFPVTGLLSDDKARVWLAGGGDTLYVAVGARTYPIPLNSGNHFNQVNTIYQSKIGDMYVATFSSGLFCIPHTTKNIFDKSQWIHAEQSSSRLANNIYAITEDKNGRIWLGTYAGVTRYDPATNELDNIYTSPHGDVISQYIIRAVFADEHNILWCGTDDGLVLIKEDKPVKKFTSSDSDTTSLTNNRVTAIFGTKDKKIWIGTTAGLNLFDPEQNNFKRFTFQNGLPAETIMSIREDAFGNLWMGTNNGLVKFDVGQNKFTKYTVEDGLCSNEFQPNASSVNNIDTIFYFGTSKGIVSFNPTRVSSNNFIPPVVITDVKILDAPLASLRDTALTNTYRREKKLLLKYDQNFFSFEFASLSYNNPQANQYAYMLTGIDRQWRHAGTQHFAAYTDIRPGHYVFKVRGSNNDGIWNDQPVMIDVIITPPWWQTWWFFALCFVAACAIVYVVYRIRIQQVLKLYKLRSSIAKDLHDDVGSALSSIALLSNISQEAKAKARLEPEQIFSRIGDTSKRMIDLMDDIVWSVNPDNDRFSNMLVRMREYAVEMLESKDIDFSFRVPEEMDELRIPMQMRKDYFLIFKEAVNNLAKYSQCTKAEISIRKENKNIVTLISDNGKGFRLEVLNSGNGLKNMRQRATAIKAKIDIQSIEGHGTTITLYMPVM